MLKLAMKPWSLRRADGGEGGAGMVNVNHSQISRQGDNSGGMHLDSQHVEPVGVSTISEAATMIIHLAKKEQASRCNNGSICQYSSRTTSTPPNRNISEYRESGHAYSDECGGEALEETPLKLRENTRCVSLGRKGQKVCEYEMCESPMHSKKWRIVTSGTSAGGRDWKPLLGKTLCDSCYTTYRKHGTFVRSIRINGGWSRCYTRTCNDEVESVGIKPVSALAEAVVLEKAKNAKKVPLPRTQRAIKRPRCWGEVTDKFEKEQMLKSEDCKTAFKVGGSGWAEDERELLEAVAILNSLQNSPPCPYCSDVPKVAAPSAPMRAPTRRGLSPCNSVTRDNRARTATGPAAERV